MDVLLLGIDGAFRRFLRDCIGPSGVPKVQFSSHSLKGDRVPEVVRWDLVFLDGKVSAHPQLADAIKKNQIEGLKIVLTEKGDLRPAIDFWGTTIYSYLLKPVERELLRLVWRNARERIQLRRKLSHVDNEREKLRAIVLEHQEAFRDMFVSHLEMQELNQKKTTFLARTAHELGTPLTALQGYLDLLANQKTGPVNELQLQLLKRSLDSCRRLSQLASSLMDLSALDGIEGHLQLELGDIQECISGAVSELSQAVEAKGLDLKIHTVSGIPPFRFDANRMHEVFVNLLENSCKFTAPGGSIRIYCEPYSWERRAVQEMIESPKERRGRTAPGGCNSVRVVVEDTGVGISSESLLDIFEEYTREIKETGSGKGFGLGLAISRQIVLAHQGKIWADSKAQQGSFFTVLIPTTL